MDYAIMLFVLAFIAVDILYKAKFKSDSSHFFDLDNSKALRGLWCLVVVLVHVPAAYQNKIQDMIGSFAYIGVTFFFMTSGFGIALSYYKNPDSIKIYWRKRLPKLLITAWVVALFSQVAAYFILGEKISIAGIFGIGGWILWLIICYFVFWITHIYRFKNKAIGDILCSILLVLFSLTLYFLKLNKIVHTTIWSTECYGFIWGILLHRFKVQFVEKMQSKWIQKTIAFMLVSICLGLVYLKFKPIVFAGDYLLKIVLGVAITAFILATNVKIAYGNKINFFLGEISFEIYLIHGRTFKFVAALVPEISSGLFILTAIIVTVAISLIVHIIVVRLVKLVYLIPFMSGKRIKQGNNGV